MSAREKVNILMVDDQPAKLLSYETILSELGENLVRASSGTEALDKMLRSDFAVLLVDVNMPDLDGFELARIVREHPRFQKTAIIFVSAVHLTDLDRLKGYQLGAVDYVPVPVIPEILRAKISVFIELFRKTYQLEQMNNQLEQRVAERTAELTASEERFRLATEAMRGGLYDSVPPRKTVWRSDGLAALLGYESGEEITGVDWWQSSIHPDDLLRGWQDAQSALGDPAIPTYDAQYRIRHREGQWIWVWDRARIVRDNDGRVLRIVGHVTDVSDQKQAEDLLKEADQRKNEFLATLSHELRNPLAPIRNAVNILRMKGARETDLRKSRDVIDRQVHHLSRLVDDLLDVSRITRGKLEIRRARTSVGEAISAAVEASAPLMEQHHHTLTLSVAPSLYVDGDVVRLTQVFTNLLNNSARYTPSGGRITLTAEGDGDWISVRVTDNGRGIPETEIHQLFDMFYQGRECPPNSHDGFGIGLTLVARIIDLHGGEIHVHSDGPNSGSEFVVRLPALPAATPIYEHPDPELHEMSESPSMRRVLIADDSVDSAESLAVLLGLQGYEVRTVHDGPEAVEAAFHFAPDAALLDIGMPTMNGYDVAARIREQPWGRNMLLIAQTGWGEDRDRRRSKEAGFDAHLTKPLDYSTLVKLLDGLTRRERAAKISP